MLRPGQEYKDGGIPRERHQKLGTLGRFPGREKLKRRMDDPGTGNSINKSLETHAGCVLGKTAYVVL